MTVIAPVQIPAATETEWLAARRQGVTASEIASVMGLAPDTWPSPYALYHRKRGDLPDIEDTIALRVGRHFESLVCELFSDARPQLYLVGDGRELYAHPTRPWQLATPDSLVYEGRGDSPVAVFEAKTAASYDGWGPDGSDEIPVHYRCQVLWQCDVTGVDSWFLACLFTHSRALRIYEGVIGSQAEADLEVMRGAAREFLDRIRWDNPPDVDWRPQTSAALKHLHPSLEDRDAIIPRALARQYKAACRAYKAAEQRKKAAENRIRDRIGPASRARTDDQHGPGEVIASRQVYEVKEHTRKASTVDKLVPAKPSKDAA